MPGSVVGRTFLVRGQIFWVEEEIFWVEKEIFPEVVGRLGDCLGWLVWLRRLLVSVDRNRRGCRISKMATNSNSSSKILMNRTLDMTEAVKERSREQGRIMDRLVLDGYFNR